jgi:hypothetical protein
MPRKYDKELQGEFGEESKQAAEHLLRADEAFVTRMRQAIHARQEAVREVPLQEVVE